MTHKVYLEPFTDQRRQIIISKSQSREQIIKSVHWK
jgi:hypothetical protein